MTLRLAAALLLASLGPAWGMDESGMIEYGRSLENEEQDPPPAGDEEEEELSPEEEAFLDSQDDEPAGERTPGAPASPARSAGPASVPSGGVTPNSPSSSSRPAGPSAAQKKAARKESAARRAAGRQSAQRMAQTLKSMGQNPAGALAAAGLGPGGAPPGAAPAGAAAPGVPAPGGAPARAPTPEERKARDREVSSWMGAHRGLAESRGLTPRVGPDGTVSFTRRDGRPADAREVAALRAAAAREPGALTRYPDLFASVPRTGYEAIRGELARAPGRPEFRDMGLSPDEKRDVVWSRSCAKVSGDCNPLSDQASYKEKDFVSPGTLKNVWNEADAWGDILDSIPESDRPRSRVGRRLGPIRTGARGAAYSPEEAAEDEGGASGARAAAARAPGEAAEKREGWGAVWAEARARLPGGPASGRRDSPEAPAPRRVASNPLLWLALALAGAGAYGAFKR